MKSVVVLSKGNIFKTFVLNEDGSARENGKQIQNFADLFLDMIDLGYRKVSEVNVVADSTRETTPISVVSTRETFRNQWNAYLSEYSDNLEVEYV